MRDRIGESSESETHSGDLFDRLRQRKLPASFLYVQIFNEPTPDHNDCLTLSLRLFKSRDNVTRCGNLCGVGRERAVGSSNLLGVY